MSYFGPDGGSRGIDANGDPINPPAAPTRCDHAFVSHVRGGEPISVRVCILCRQPDWADLRDQVEAIRVAAQHETARALRGPRVQLSPREQDVIRENLIRDGFEWPPVPAVPADEVQRRELERREALLAEAERRAQARLTPDPSGTGRSDANGDDLKTPDAWLAELHPGTQVLDPDGWRGKNGRPWDDPITRDEFHRRFVLCTVTGPTRTATATEVHLSRRPEGGWDLVIDGETVSFSRASDGGLYLAIDMADEVLAARGISVKWSLAKRDSRYEGVILP